MSEGFKRYASEQYVDDTIKANIKASYINDLCKIINSETSITLVEGVDVSEGDTIEVTIKYGTGGSVIEYFPAPPEDYTGPYVPQLYHGWSIFQEDIFTTKVAKGCSYEISNGGADIKILTAKSNLSLENDIKSLEKTINNKIDNAILSQSKNVYVSPSGSDITGDGTSSKPWKTITKAIEYGPVARNGFGLYYTINIAAGTYTEDIVISDKKVRLNLLGDVTIQPASGNTILGVYRNARVSIVSDENNKKSLTLSGGTIGIGMSHESTLVFSDLSNLIFDNITNTCISCSHNTYLYINYDSNGSDLDKITINSTCNLKSIVKSHNNSHVELETTMDINANSSCSNYAFESLTDSYLLISKLTIPSTYSKGILASHMGRVNTINVTNNATTPTNTALGGLIAGYIS